MEKPKLPGIWVETQSFADKFVTYDVWVSRRYWFPKKYKKVSYIDKVGVGADRDYKWWPEEKTVDHKGNPTYLSKPIVLLGAAVMEYKGKYFVDFSSGVLVKYEDILAVTKAEVVTDV